MRRHLVFWYAAGSDVVRASWSLHPMMPTVGATRTAATFNVTGPTKPLNAQHMQALARRAASFVPTFFSTMHNVQAKLPTELREAVASAGGMQAVVEADCEGLYVVSKLGRVVVVRSREGAGTSRTTAGPTREHRASTSRDGDGDSMIDPDGDHATDSCPSWCARNLFPRFTVPLADLILARRKVQVGEGTDSDVLPKLTHIGRPVTLEEESHVVASTELLGGAMECLEMGGKRYVRPRRVGNYYPAVLAAATSRGTVPNNTAGSGTDNDVLERMEGEHEGKPAALPTALSPLEDVLVDAGALVEPYEIYRVARLVSCREWMQVTPQLRAECQELLPPGRTLDHVLLAAPHLFQVDVGGCDDVRRRDVGRVRYCLPWGCIDRRPASDDLVRQITQKVQSLRQDRFPDRSKMRRLLRRLEAIQNPSPYLDPDVFAYAVVDALPVSGVPMPFTRIVNRFTESQRNCRPEDLQAFLQQYRHLFVASQLKRTSNELYLMRCDSELGSIVSQQGIATDEEIVVSMFERFPSGVDPLEPLRYANLRPRLTLRVQQAVRERTLEAIVASQSTMIEIVAPTDPSRGDEIGGAATLVLSRRARFGGGEDREGGTLLRFKGTYLESLKNAYDSNMHHR